jgi:hypothetical protein
MIKGITIHFLTFLKTFCYYGAAYYRNFEKLNNFTIIILGKGKREISLKWEMG